MKVASLVILSICLGVLNAISAASITKMTPAGVVTAAAATYTFTVVTTDFSSIKVVKFYKGTETSTTLQISLTATGSDPTTDVSGSIKFPSAGEYTMKVVDGSNETPQTATLTVTPTIIKSITTKIKKDTDESVTLTSATGHIIGTQKIQFSATAPTDATTPTPITCTPATPATTATCPVNLKEGNYTLYVDTVSSGLVLQVSSQYLKLAFGLLISLFLF